MTAAKPATAPSTYVTGLCASGLHDRCRGAYAGAECTCPHHDEPPPPEPVRPRILSEFSGYGGLDLAVQSILGGQVVAHAEIEPAACRILEHRFPGVPNLGDISTVDWSTVGPVDVICGGFPCQDVSCAGKRAGLRPDTRSGLWSQMAYSIAQLRPSLVIAENVRGLLSAPADGVVEPCPWCVGDDEGCALRALGAVLGDLAELGYDAAWTGLRASDVGAPHGRFRVFVVAWPAEDAHVATRGQRRLAAPGQAEGGRPWADAGRRGGAPATHPYGNGLVREPGAPAGRNAIRADQRGDADGCSADATAYPESLGRDQGWTEPARLVGRSDDAARRDGDAADADLPRLEGGEPTTGHQLSAWGPYGDAVRRWERVTRPAPTPTEPSKTGQPRLSPAFVEWMMGLPDGWVTQVPGLTRNEQLKALGNGVVPQQAAEALRLLLPDVQAVAS